MGCMLEMGWAHEMFFEASFFLHAKLPRDHPIEILEGLNESGQFKILCCGLKLHIEPRHISGVLL